MDNKIHENFIDSDGFGINPIPNLGSEIKISDGLKTTTGETGAVEKNVIAFNNGKNFQNLCSFD